MKTKIYYNIENSPHDAYVGEWTFRFSSETNKNKFEWQYEDYLKNETLKLKNKYSFLNIDFDLFLIVSLYKRIEKRGFKVNYNGIDLKEDTQFITSFVDGTSVHF